MPHLAFIVSELSQMDAGDTWVRIPSTGNNDTPPGSIKDIGKIMTQQVSAGSKLPMRF